MTAPYTGYLDGAHAELAVAKLAALKQQQLVDQKPFFYAVGIGKPHSAYCAPQDFWDYYEGAVNIAEFEDEIPYGQAMQNLDNAYTKSNEVRKFAGISENHNNPIPDAMMLKLHQSYYACVSYADWCIGQVLDALEAEGLADNTIVVLWSDHGYQLGEQNQWA